MFVTFEGIEGSGKTTQIQKIAEFLSGRGKDCLITREPGGTKIGEKVRAILLDPQSKDMDPMTELLLYKADRVQHVKKLVVPSLSSGKIVLCDRYVDATVVYQGFARGLDVKLINTLHKLLLEDLKPEITILLDLSPEVGLSRAWKQIENGKRDGFETRFEKEAFSFHQKVREGYLELARLEPERFRIVDASKNETQVCDEIINLLCLNNGLGLKE
jgi:dTMP kinase